MKQIPVFKKKRQSKTNREVWSESDDDKKQGFMQKLIRYKTCFMLIASAALVIIFLTANRRTGKWL